MGLTKERQIEYIDAAILWCFTGLVVVLPIAHVITVREFLIYIPVALWLCKMALKRGPVFADNHLILPMLLFAFVAALSLFTAVDFDYSLRQFLSKLTVDFMLFFLAFNNVREIKDVRKILFALIIGSTAQGVYSFARFFFIDNGSLASFAVKAGGLTGGYITYSVLIITVLPFIAYMVLTSAGGSRRLFFAALLLFNTFMLYLTFQRGALVALFVQVMIFLGFLRRWWICAALAAAVVLAVYALPANLVYHGSKGVDLGNEKIRDYGNTINSRVAVWKFALREIAEHPFKGAGLGRYSFAARHSQFRRTDLWHAHNTFLNTAVQLGLQGLAALLFVLWRVGRTHWLGVKESEGDARIFFMASFVFISGFFVRNMFDDLFVDDNSEMFWFLTGLAFAVFLRFERLSYKGVFSKCPAARVKEGRE
ncbi:MAG: O-antigen ligase family protein [Deltaproteobacteria bacterium]|nr:O-antigen ligase family protein [Deltaproteobacteria bacterium]